MSCRAMAFSMIVLRISFTLSRALRIPGTNPQAAPARKPTIIVRGMRSQPGQRVEGERKPGGHQRAGDDLALAADVDDVGAERDADSQPDQEQRGGLDEGLGETETSCPRRR